MATDESEVLHYLEKYASVFNALAAEVLQRSSAQGQANVATPGIFDPAKLNALLSGDIKLDPSKLLQQQMLYMQKQSDLWQSAAKAMMSEKLSGSDSAASSDKRFSHPDWQQNPVFNYIKESYLINSDMLTNIIDAVEFSDPKQAKQARFYTRQYVNSLAPTNFVLTNPEVCEEVVKTKGQNLVKGMQNFLEDLEKSPLEALKMRQTDASAFTLGENLANTPGKVVYQNDLVQLIHYQATTAKQFTKPMLIVPPFINKYYVLDLDERKSLVKGLLDAGHNVFMISWVNPDASHADKDFVDYMNMGPLACIASIKTLSKCKQVNITGFCVGGTLSATAVAYLRAQKDTSVGSLTLLTTLLDFEEPGEVGNYFAEDMLPMIEQSADIKGVFDGRIIGMSFSLLRENSLFWSFFINNYLKGKDPAPFDILYWNSDATNIPSACFKQYLSLTYWHNKLKEPGTVTIDGVPIDFANIDTPTYFLSTVADHIVLWQSAYQGAKLISGDKRFVLAGSGHLAGVINPIKGGKYPHWLNHELPDDPQQWLAQAEQQEGSWWPDWHQWLKPMSGVQRKASIPGQHPEYPALMDAPGTYVLRRLDEN